jgi:hypothetical protein
MALGVCGFGVPIAFSQSVRMKILVLVYVVFVLLLAVNANAVSSVVKTLESTENK